MTPEPIEIESLGAKHRQLNARVKTIVEAKLPVDQIMLLPEGNDIDNMIKIDVIAKSSDNLRLIEKVLCSDDMLLVSRALNKSKWLANDPRITPHYLHTNLFPHMSSKAISKLLLSIRRNTKDESKADAFYQYFKDQKKDHIANKWLHICSYQVIENAVSNIDSRDSSKLFRKLTRCKPNVIRNLSLNHNELKNSNFKECLIKSHLFMHTNTDDYLDITLKTQSKLSSSKTSYLLKTCYERIVNNIHKYITLLHMPTLINYLGTSKCSQFLKQLSHNEQMANWFTLSNLKPFLKSLTNDEKTEFFKKLFPDNDDFDEPMTDDNLRSVTDRVRANFDESFSIISSGIYEWYVVAPFYLALTDLKKLIRSESSAAERMNILKVLVKCASSDPKNVYTLISYFVMKHMNEPPLYKQYFVTNLIRYTKIYNYDEGTWEKIDQIFHSLECYTEARSDPENITPIITYKLLHGQPIPEVIAKKVMFHQWINLSDKDLTLEQKELIFIHIYNAELILLHQASRNDISQRVGNILTILEAWNKNLDDYADVVDKIRNIISYPDTEFDVGWGNSMKHFYYKNRRWRRTLISESLYLYPYELSFINILKYDPKLFFQHTEVLKRMIIDANLTRALSKIRIYYKDYLLEHFTNLYKTSVVSCETAIESRFPKSKHATRGLCFLMDRDEFKAYIKLYVPKVFKFSKADKARLRSKFSFNRKSLDHLTPDDTLINVGGVRTQMYFSRQMHLVRPTIDIDTVMQFAKEHFAAHALPSIMSVIQQNRQCDLHHYIHNVLLKGPEPLQKVGLRIATKEFSLAEVNGLLNKVWDTTRKKGLRLVVLELAFKLLKQQTSNADINNQWVLFKRYLEGVRLKEKQIIDSVQKVIRDLPESVKPECCRIVHDYLGNCEESWNNIYQQCNTFELVADCIHHVDPEWVRSVLSEYLKIIFSKDSCRQMRDKPFKTVSVAYILCSLNEEDQVIKYKATLKPYILYRRKYDKDNVWSESAHERIFCDELARILTQLVSRARSNISKGDNVYPIQLLTTVKQDIKKFLPIEIVYQAIWFLELSVLFFEICNTLPDKMHKQENILSDKCIWSQIQTEFCKRLVNALSDKTIIYFPSLYKELSRVIVLLIYQLSLDVKVELLKVLIHDKQINHHLVAIELLDSWRSDLSKEDLDDIARTIQNHDSFEVKYYYARCFSGCKSVIDENKPYFIGNLSHV